MGITTTERMAASSAVLRCGKCNGGVPGGVAGIGADGVTIGLCCATGKMLAELQAMAPDAEVTPPPFDYESAAAKYLTFTGDNTPAYFVPGRSHKPNPAPPYPEIHEYLGEPGRTASGDGRFKKALAALPPEWSAGKPIMSRRGQGLVQKIGPNPIADFSDGPSDTDLAREVWTAKAGLGPDLRALEATAPGETVGPGPGAS